MSSLPIPTQLAGNPIEIDEVDRVGVEFDFKALTAAIDEALLKAIREANIYGYLKDAFCDGTLPFKEEFFLAFNLRLNEESPPVQSDIELLLEPEVGPYTFHFISLSLIISPRPLCITMSSLLTVDTVLN